MRCSKCGRDWPSEFYFNSPEQCIYCDKEEGITRPKGVRRNRVGDPKGSKFPDLIQMFFILVLITEVLAVVGLLIYDMRAVLGDPPSIDLWLGLPISARYDNADRPNGIGIEESDFKAYMVGHYGTLIRFTSLPDAFTTLLLFFQVYKSRVLGVLITLMLLLFYRDVQRGRPFFRRNLNRLTILSLIVIFLGPVDGLLGWWIAQMFIDHLAAPAVTLRPVLDINSGLIFWGFIMLAAVQIVRRGIALQEEHDLTI
jgi:hypothetical protein